MRLSHTARELRRDFCVKCRKKIGEIIKRDEFIDTIGCSILHTCVGLSSIGIFRVISSRGQLSSGYREMIVCVRVYEISHTTLRKLIVDFSALAGHSLYI